MPTQDLRAVQQIEDTELKVAHFIPSVELKGSRAQKLEKLDALISRLERLRRSLAGDAATERGGIAGPGRYLSAPAWPWFTAGLVIGGLLTLWLLLSRAFA